MQNALLGHKSRRSRTRSHSGVAAAATALLLGVGGALLPQGSARAATPTQLTNLSFSWSGGLLARTQVKYVTVSLTLVDPDGIPGIGVHVDDTGLPCPCVELGNFNPAEPRSVPWRDVSLHLTSGTNMNGVWSGRFAVGAADAGFWRPTRMAAGDIVGPSPLPEPYLTGVPAPWNQVTMNVRGYNWPRAWLGTPVPSGSRFLVRGGVGLSRSGMPVAGMRLEIRMDCKKDPEYLLASFLRTAVRTNSVGRYAYALSAAQAKDKYFECAVANVYPTDTWNSFVVMSNIRFHG